jgi:AcrR family transcriptional regulator
MARATVYRYFPTRQALLDRVAEVGVADAGERLADARLDAVPPHEALVRAVRAFLEVGDYFTVLARERVHIPETHDRLIKEPLRRMFERGQKSGAFRRDVPIDWLTGAMIDLVEGVVSANPTLGRDDTVELVSSLFLDGARGRPSAGQRRPRRAP